MKQLEKFGPRGFRAACSRHRSPRKRRAASLLRREIVEATITMMGEAALDTLPADRIVLAFPTGKRGPGGALEVQVGTARRSSAFVDELLGCVAAHERAELRASLAPTLTHVPIVALERGVTCALWARASSAPAASCTWGAS